MSDEPQDIVAKAEALLAGITPGKWVIEDDTADKRGHDDDTGIYLIIRSTVTRKAVVEGYDEYGPTLRVGDAAFIAAAPDLVRELIAEVKRLRAQQAEAYQIVLDAFNGATWAGDHTYGVARALEYLQHISQPSDDNLGYGL